MRIDRQRVKERFASYTRGYDPEDTKIALKIAHTYRVADYCEQIARSIGLTDDEVEFAWLSGMLHDIGRSVGNVQLAHVYHGWKMMNAMGYNKYRMDAAISGKTLVFCNILRDADKVDIFRVNVETPMEEIYNVSSDVLFSSGVSEKVMEQVRERHAINRDIMNSPAEHLIGHIALTFELVYEKSREIAKEQGYLYKMFDFPTRNESTKKALTEIRSLIDD